MNWINLLNVILSSIITSIIILLCTSNISNEKISFKIFIKNILILFPSFIIIFSFFEGVTRLVFNIIMITISLYFSIFNKNIQKSVYYTLVYEIYAFFIEIITSVIFVSIFKFNLNNYNNFPFSLTIFSIVNSMLVYIVSKFNTINKGIRRFNIIISKNIKDQFYIASIIVLMVCMLAYNGYILNNNLSFYINIGMTIFIFLTLIYVIYNKFQKENVENKYNEMMDYVSKYEKIINEQGKKNHEFNNQLMVLKGYLKNPDKLKEYLDLIIQEQRGGQNYDVKQLGALPDGGIKGLIYHKLSKMQENNIKYYLYIDSQIKDIFETKLDINTYRDVTKLLGVFIDNAIDASKDADPKEIELDIKIKNDNLIITISNTYDNSIDTNQIGKKGFSTKGSGHGFGLSIVKDIKKNNKNIDTFNDINNNMFRQTIIIYYK